MEEKDINFYNACLNLFGTLQKELMPHDGYYYVDFNFFKATCGKQAESVFLEVGISDISKDTEDTNKALYIQEDGVADAIEYYNNKINKN